MKQAPLHLILVNTLRPRQNCRHFADDIFKCIFLNENVWISFNISLKCVPKGPINNIPALVQIMASHRPGDKSLSEPMIVNLLAHVCVTRPQWDTMSNDSMGGENKVNWENIIWFLSIYINNNLVILRLSIVQIIKSLIVFEIIGSSRYSRLQDQGSVGTLTSPRSAWCGGTSDPKAESTHP